MIYASHSWNMLSPFSDEIFGPSSFCDVTTRKYLQNESNYIPILRDLRFVSPEKGEATKSQIISLRMFILMSIIHNNHRRKRASKNAKIEVT